MRILCYWLTTAAVALELIIGGMADLLHAASYALTVVQLGYPMYLLTILGVFKLLGAIAILVPRFPRLKEWAYAGVIIEMIGASGSLIARSGGVDIIWPLVIALLALISWAFRPPSRTLGVLFRKEDHQVKGEG